ncbi:hypothetical protein ABE94_008230 [Escherichia coli]|nr:hypothetical protein ABE94_008230 [Escherichia coli]
MTTETRSLYSQLPAIDRLLRDSSFLSLRDTYGHTRVVELLRQMLDEAREVIRGSQTLPAWCENWAQEVDARLTKEAQSALRPVINLTGTVLHTNLGRALQAEAAVEAVAQAMRSPVTLEYDLDDAGRGHRDRALAQLLCRITGAEDACRSWSSYYSDVGVRLSLDADIAIVRWRSCCAALRGRKMPVSLITMRRRCY